MKKINLAIKMMQALVLFFVIYNFYFGWNEKPINEVEETCDYIFKVGLYFSWAIYFLPILDVYQNFIKKHELINKNQ